MISKEQIEQIVQKTLAQMKDSQCQCTASDNGWQAQKPFPKPRGHRWP